VTLDPDPTKDEFGRNVYVDGSGAIYVGINRFTTNAASLARLTPTGALDTTFDSDGIRDETFAGSDSSYEYLGYAGAVPALDGGVYFVGVVRSTKYGTTPVPDFASGSAVWTVGATGMFGVCLRDVAAGASTDVTTWTNDTADHDCADGNADPWRAIPATTGAAASKVAFSSGTGNTNAYMRFGFRAGASLAPGTYIAPVALTVLSPTA
jgi:hypothetical protein